VHVHPGRPVPNLQVLDRTPIRRALPGSVEQREFEYTRHGTANLLTRLVVHTGRMRVSVLPRNDGASYVWALRQFRADYVHLRGVYLIHDASVDPTGAVSEILGISSDCSIHSARIDVRETISAGGFDVVSFSRNVR
jgi:hypothetical protein